MSNVCLEQKHQTLKNKLFGVLPIQIKNFIKSLKRLWNIIENNFRVNEFHSITIDWGQKYTKCSMEPES